ncbi:MAG: NAD(P)-dependent alcohol dehydrogenase [candidate division Zixibacteria bacterium]|nr:NAD(P)-dependent alcohol dehydrogenase [candidate division Zixibacteria bacterium]
MKAITYHNYGSPDVLKIEEVGKPAVGDNDVLVRVRAVAVNPYDWHFMRGKPYFMRLMTGLGNPKKTHFGADFSGVVEAVGKNIAIFKPGDEVFGCKHGAFAEYVCVPEKALALKPKNLAFEEAAAVPMAGLTALQALRDSGGIQSGQKVLINGASGGVGSFGVQIARSYGCDVTGVCSGRNVELVRSLGADQVIDYTKQNFTESGMHYDLILDCVGNRSIFAFRRALTPRGTYVGVGGGGGDWLGPLTGLLTVLIVSWFVRQHVTGMIARITRQDLVKLAELIESGKMKPVIDRRYTFGEVREAMSYLEEGHVRGKLVIVL